MIYSAGSTMCHCPNSPNTAPATIMVPDEPSFTSGTRIDAGAVFGEFGH